MGGRRRAKDEDVVRITSAPASPADDLRHRERRYALTMGIRTACFIAAVLTIRIPWLCLILIGASFVLPYVAVVMANSASPRIEGTPPPDPGISHREIEGPDAGSEPRDT